MNPITLSIQYAGMTLQVVKNDAGEDVTPLKPFADMLGLKWETQRKKVTKSVFYRPYLGVCVQTLGGPDDQRREQTCILVSRVEAFLMSINPVKVKAGGNVSGAELLHARLRQWADVLHELHWHGIGLLDCKSKFEEGVKQLAGFFTCLNLAESDQERAAVSRLIAEAFVELGQPLEAEAQQDLPGV